MPWLGKGDALGRVGRGFLGPLVAAGPVVGTAATKYSFAGTRMRWPVGKRNVSTNNFSINSLHIATPDYPISNPRFFLPNFYTTGATAANEFAVGNVINIEGLAIKNPADGLLYTAPGGPWTIQTTDTGILLPAIPVSGIPANSVMEVRICYNTQVNGDLPVQTKYAPNLAPNPIDTTNSGTSSKLSLLTLAANIAENASHPDQYLPAYMIAQGGDGRFAYLLSGDSIGYGVGEENLTILWDARYNYGYISRGMDDNLSSRRIAINNMCIPGDDWDSWAVRANVAKKYDSLKLAYTANGYWPFDAVLSEHMHNRGLSTPYLAAFQAFLTSMATEWGKPIVLVEALPNPTSSDGWGSLAGETSLSNYAYPAGIWAVSNAASNNGVADPTKALRTGGYIADSFAAWTTAAFDATTANRDKHPISSLTTPSITPTTSASGIPSNFNVTSSAGFNVGDGIVVGNTGNATLAAGIVTAIPDGTHLTIANSQNGTSNWAAGATVRQWYYDAGGVHPSSWFHANVLKAAVTAWKAARGL
jgi:hypothetical protein